MSRKKTLKNTKPFSVPITTEIEKVGRNGEENKKTISWKFQVLHYTRFVKGSLSNLADGIHQTKCKYEQALTLCKSLCVQWELPKILIKT